ncbi:TPA: pathogenicity island protein [Staphylococcus aureus]|nr:pathogenicity island protein [Staphylococcus aureus]
MKITNIRLKSANKKSVKKLYFLEGIDAIEKIENNYEKKVFLVSILEGIRQYSTQNYKIECDFKKFHYRIFQYYRIIKRKLKETVKNFDEKQVQTLSKIYNKLCNVSDKNNYIGQILEYTYIKYIRTEDSVYKIGHEPIVYHKRKSLHGKESYSNRLLDFVTIENRKTIILCECKANLQREFQGLIKHFNKPFRQKLQLMNHLEDKLKQCHSGNEKPNNFVEIKKVLVTAFAPTNQQNLSRRYQREIPILTISDMKNMVL